MSEAREDPRPLIATGCRILAQHGLAHEILGHISLRIPGTDEMWIRCRGLDERGVRYTRPEAIHRIKLDGTGEVPEGYQLPMELPIHGQVLAARPDVAAVVHAHPTYTVLCGIGGVDLKPVYGAFDSTMVDLVGDGLPVYSRSRLINDLASAADLVDAMGTSDACLMRGHGVTVVGRSVEEAVLRAVRLERLAWFCWQLTAAQVAPASISADDLAFFKADVTLGVPKSTEWAWRYYEVTEAQARG